MMQESLPKKKNKKIKKAEIRKRRLKIKIWLILKKMMI